MTIRSNPTGAMLYVDNREIGSTPVSADFTYYGTREFRLVKDGYETLTEKRTIPVPWYQFVPLDFVAENLVPGTVRDHRTIDFQLVPQRVVPTEEILGRGESLRRDTHALNPVPSGPVPGLAPQAPPGRGIRPAPTAPWGSAPPAFAPGPSSAVGLPYPSGSGPAFAPGATPPSMPGSSVAPGAGLSPPAGPAPNDLLPYPTEPPGGWQPRG